MKNNDKKEDAGKNEKKALKAKHVATVYIWNVISALIPLGIFFTGYFTFRNKRRVEEHDGISWHRDRSTKLAYMTFMIDVALLMYPKVVSGTGHALAGMTGLVIAGGVSYVIYKNIKSLYLLIEHEIEEKI